MIKTHMSFQLLWAKNWKSLTLKSTIICGHKQHVCKDVKQNNCGGRATTPSKSYEHVDTYTDGKYLQLNSE